LGLIVVGENRVVFTILQKALGTMIFLLVRSHFAFADANGRAVVPSLGVGDGQVDHLVAITDAAWLNKVHLEVVVSAAQTAL